MRAEMEALIRSADFLLGAENARLPRLSLRLST
ncbi:hypothetical protein HD597_009009 [Nonomuraea thailandensis]|uniref:Uncharacterized protein n=1 Tax=Nonomuraea thailandensis TaxID=1188745 RepID=A0A9X2K701_9ACTN|nr:hypothetical protein [Nonomuraea thailandensis]